VIRRLIVGMVLLIVTLAGSRVAAFQGATPVASPVASPEASPLAADVTPEGLGNFYNYFSAGTLADLGYQDVTTPNGQSIVEYFLPLPTAVTPVAESTMTLVFSHSPLLRADVSTMTVLINGMPAASVFLDDSNLERAELEIPFPGAAAQPGGVLVQVAFSMRLSRDSCEDIDNVGLWATIHAESAFDLRSHAIVGEADLATLQEQFTGFSEPLTIVLPEHPSATERDAASAIAARVGAWNARQTGTLQIVTSSDPAAIDSGPAIYIGSGERLPTPMNWTGLIWDGARFNSSNGPVDPDHGVVALLQQPYPALLVSGATEQALDRAVTAVTDARYSSQLSGPYRVVTAVEPVADTPIAPWSKPRTVFADLGFEPRTVRGEGTSGIDLLFSRPPEWIAGNDGTLDLRLQASAALRTDTSWIAVSVNGVPLGTQPIVASESTMTYRFPLAAAGINTPVDGQASNILHLRIDLHLELPRHECEAIDPTNAWATLLDDSGIVIPHDTYTGLDLARLPAPVLQAESDAPYIIAVPDAANSADLTAALQTAFAFGLRSGDPTAGFPSIRNATEVTDAEKQAASIVAIGTAETNPILADIDIGTAIPGIAASSDPNAGTTISIVESPWSDDGAVVAIVPASGDTAIVSELMASTAVLARLTGTSSSIGADQVVTQTGAAEAPLLPPDSTPDIASDITREPEQASDLPGDTGSETDPADASARDDEADEDLPPWQVAGAIILGGIVVGIGAFLWIRLTGRKGTP
jgi:hypothetical protein